MEESERLEVAVAQPNPSGKNRLAIMGKEGHTTVEWSPENQAEVTAALEKFAELKSKGYAAFSVSLDESRGKQLDKFDKTLPRILFAPQIQGG